MKAGAEDGMKAETGTIGTGTTGRGIIDVRLF
jgi:hypothetical protein